MNDPAFPKRPDHPDFNLLTSILRDWDSTLDNATGEEEKDRSQQAIVAERIDEASLYYVAEQRAMRGLGIVYASELEQRSDEVALLAAVYYEAVLVGIEFERRRASKQDERTGSGR